MKLSAWIILATAALFGGQVPAAAQSDQAVEYRIKQGDTLYDLSKSFFVNEGAIADVMRINRIRNARRLPVGGVLSLPRRLLRYEPQPLRVLTFSGPVTISHSGSKLEPRLGVQVAEGAIVETGARGFISLGGTGNSRLSLPSNSRVRVDGARRYLINDAIDFDIRVLKGRSEIVAPKLKDQERFRVGTPQAVTAVRGTKFRVAYKEAAERSLTEVVEGNVEVMVGEENVAAAAGSGVAANALAIGAAEPLLPAPALVDAGSIQTGEDVTFTVEDLGKAKGYRTQLARDAGFVEVIAEQISSDEVVAFDDIADGRLFVRSRAIAESELEGLTEVYSFRRKRLGAAVSVEASPFDDAYKFIWLPEGVGKSYAGFQLWDAKQPDTLLVDEIGVEFQGFYVSNVEPGDYRWRVATFQIDEGEVIKVWGPVQEFKVTG